MENLFNLLKGPKEMEIWFQVYEVSKQAKLNVMIEVRLAVCLWWQGGAF